MQTKDIPDEPIIEFLKGLGTQPATSTEGYDHSVQNAMPEGVNGKLARSKMKSMIKRGIVDGCACGCRGDYMLVPEEICFKVLVRGDKVHFSDAHQRRRKRST